MLETKSMKKHTIIKIGYENEDGTLSGFIMDGSDSDASGISVNTKTGETLYGGYTLEELRVIARNNEKDKI